MRRRTLLLAALLAVGVCTPLRAQTRYANLSKKFDHAPDRATVVSAGYFGGNGTEWLVGGGFQPHGTDVVAGTTLGPTFAVGKTTAAVLGTDAAPAAPEVVFKKDAKGKVVLDKKTNKPLGEPFAWTHKQATGFVARLSPDLETVKSLTRFPWASGGITSCAVDGDGNVYVAGPATDAISQLSKPTPLTPGDANMKSGGCGRIHVTKLSPAADKVTWLVTLAGTSDAPGVRLTKDGRVTLRSVDLRTLSPEGKQPSLVTVPGGITTKQGGTDTRTTAVNPRDGTFVRAGEHHWRTGREPYRDPILNVHRADGSLLYELYNWDGPLVGVDGLRLVSDTAVRRVRFDEDGNLVIYAWSDGGNSVMYREPNDLRKVSKKMDGLGMSAWGGGVLSCAYLIKIETTNYKIVGGTLRLAYLNDRDKPNNIWLDTLGFANDGSLVLGGKSAYGLIQTGNAIGKSAPTGPYVAVLSKDCTSLRFSSALPNTAEVDVCDGERWGFAAGNIGGKPHVPALGSAVAGAKSEGAMQAGYGGGLTDGYMILLDLSK